MNPNTLIAILPEIFEKLNDARRQYIEEKKALAGKNLDIVNPNSDNQT